MGKYFGTDGFRGEANVTLTTDQAYRVGRYLGNYFRTRKEDGRARVVIGKDTRISSYTFEYAIAAGIAASGSDVYIMHVTTTPSVAYITRTDEFDCGVIISASHNPFHDNGIKLINRNGEKMDGEVIAEIERYLDGEPADLPFAVGDQMGQIIDYVSGRNRYIGYLISLGMFSFRGVKVGLDCANGSSWSIAKSVFEALGATVHVINADPNGLNINEDAGSTHIEGLQKLVKENKLDIGFAYDGDADRCLCVDEKGRVLTGDHILLLYAKYMKSRGKLTGNTVVTTVMSNLGLYKALDDSGIEYAKTAVGDKYVYEYMKEHGNLIGGEQSGHIIFSKYATTGDGILTSLKIMEVMLARKIPASKFYDELTIYPQTLINVRVQDKQTALSNETVQALIRETEDKLGEDGRVLVRESGTEPLVRVMVEAKSERECKKLAQRIADAIKTTQKPQKAKKEKEPPKAKKEPTEAKKEPPKAKKEPQKAAPGDASKSEQPKAQKAKPEKKRAEKPKADKKKADKASKAEKRE